MARPAVPNNLERETYAITPEMALRLGALFGNSPEHWMAMQARYDLAIAREQLADELAAMPTLAAEAA